MPLGDDLPRLCCGGGNLRLFIRGGDLLSIFLDGDSCLFIRGGGDLPRIVLDVTLLRLFIVGGFGGFLVGIVGDLRFIVFSGSAGPSLPLYF